MRKRKNGLRDFPGLMLVLALLTLMDGKSAWAAHEFINFQEAGIVIGQADFTSNSTAVDQSTARGAVDVALSAQGKLAISSQNPDRILLWNSVPTSNGQPADVVLGKISFTDSSTASPSATNLGTVYGIAFSPDGSKLIAADTTNHRVLIWNTIPTTNGAAADVVIGQNSFTSSSSGTSATKLNTPSAIMVTSEGKLLVGDYFNNRVLIYNSIPTTNGAAADVVIGQPNFTANSTGNARNRMHGAFHTALAPDGRLLIIDGYNYRVLVYNSIPTANNAAADVVIGTGTQGTAANVFSSPGGVAVSQSGQLAISDTFNHRVLLFDSIPTTDGEAADGVLGQPDFTSKTEFNGGISARSMRYVYGLTFDERGRLFVSGFGMNRVMVFNASNNAPIAGADSATIDEGAGATGIDVLSNDSDDDDDSIIIESVSQPAHGTINLTGPTGAATGLTYTPDADFSGADSFEYSISDGYSESEASAVTITVNAINDAPSFTKGANQTVDEDSGAQSVTNWATLISAGPASESTQTVNLLFSNNSALFSVQPSISSNGTLTYTPAPNANGVTTFSVRIQDNGGTTNGGVDSSATQTFTITINAVNDAPMAVDDPTTIARTAEDYALDIAVLNNDTDIDTNNLNLRVAPNSIANVRGGIATVSTNGRFVHFTPTTNANNSNTSGGFGFTYKVTDGTLVSTRSATASVSVTPVNDAPVASGQSVTLLANTPKIITLSASDVEGSALTYVVVSGPSHGTLSNGTSSTRTYTPNTNYAGSDSFTFKANDGTADSNTVTVNITVNAVNNAPAASGQSVTVDANTSKVIRLSASDVENSPLTYSIVSGPSHGTLSGTSSTRTYTPNTNYIGSDSFTFKANDGSVDSNIAIVNITVEGPLNVTSGIVIERGSFIAAASQSGNFGLRKQVQFVTLKNKSGAAISGPVYLALDNLNRANLTNASGFTTKAPLGIPYIAVNVGNDNVFNVNEKVTIQLNFTPTSSGTITYNTRVLAGSGTP